MQLNRNFSPEGGFTLLEVLFALLISTIFLTLALRLLLDQWRGAHSLKSHLEAQYSVLTAGKTITDEIRKAQTIEWVKNPGMLKILPMPSELPTDDCQASPPLEIDYDKYYIDDLDLDGIKDLYWMHLGVAEPLASYITELECTEVEPGLWEVDVTANVDGQVAAWRSIIMQRAPAPALALITDIRSSIFFTAQKLRKAWIDQRSPISSVS